MNLVLLGAPGAGKGTQAKVLSKQLGIPHISTGDMLRDAVAKDAQLGRKAREYMIKGELVPDGLVTRIVSDTLASEAAGRGFILDGYPRNLKQAKVLDKTLAGIKKKLDFVLYLKTSVDTSVGRLSGRRVCKKCGSNFHIRNIPPKKEGICDFCGGGLYQRKDDSEETVRRRWAVYEKQTAPVVSYFEKKGVLREVSGDLDVDGLNRVLTALFRKEKGR